MHPHINLFSASIPTFYLIISISLTILLYSLSLRLESKLGTHLNRQIAFQLSLVIMIFGFIGARLFHVFYESFNYYAKSPINIFMFWNGGYVYYGGFLLSILASFIFLRFKNEHFLEWADFLSPLLAASYAFGRLGCFFEGCCFGSYCELAWAIQSRHPVQLYMGFTELLLVFLILFVEKKILSKTIFKFKYGLIFFCWLSLHSLSRFFFEYFRDDNRGRFLLNLSISQVLSLLVLTLSIIYLSIFNLGIYNLRVFLFRKFKFFKLKT